MVQCDSCGGPMEPRQDYFGSDQVGGHMCEECEEKHLEVLLPPALKRGKERQAVRPAAALPRRLKLKRQASVTAER